MSRAETGPMEFEGDWPGVFLRGDNAAWYAMALREALDALQGMAQHTSTILTIASLLSDLEGSRVVQGKEPVGTQRMEPFSACVRRTHPSATDPQATPEQIKERMQGALALLEVGTFHVDCETDSPGAQWENSECVVRQECHGALVDVLVGENKDTPMAAMRAAHATLEQRLCRALALLRGEPAPCSP